MITILEVDDWMALYKDGALLDQNHSIHYRDILDATGVKYEYRWLESDEAASEFGDGEEFMEFPERLPDA